MFNGNNICYNNAKTFTNEEDRKRLFYKSNKAELFPVKYSRVKVKRSTNKTTNGQVDLCEILTFI